MPERVDVFIRKARPSDWKQILPIQQSKSVFPFIGQSLPRSRKRVEERWKTRLKESNVHTLVAESDEGKVVGYIRLKQGEGLGSHAGEISTLAVHPYHQSRGVGRRLLERALEPANELSLRRVWLTVREDNHAAISLYERMGFEVEGREREAVQKGRGFVDLLIMGRLEHK